VSAAFTTSQQSFFTFLIALLRSQNISDIDNAIALNVMVDQNFMAAASDGSLRYWLAGRRPDRSLQAMANAWSVLNGNNASEVFDSTIAMPTSAWPLETLSSTGGAEVWINNNVDPRLTRRPTSLAPPGLSPWSLTSCSLGSTYRQLRARKLLDPLSPAVAPSGLTRAKSKETLLDVRDNWAETLLPYFAASYLDLINQGFANSAQLPTVASFIVPLLDGSWSPKDATQNCEYAARAWTLRHVYVRLLRHLRSAWGLPLPPLMGESIEPEFFPDMATFLSSSLANGLSHPHTLNLLTFGMALEMAATEVWPSIVSGNTCWSQTSMPIDPFASALIAPFPQFVPTTCTANPSLACPPMPSLVLGQMRRLDLSIAGAPIYFPMDGVYDSLYASPTIDEGSFELSHFNVGSCTPFGPVPAASSALSNVQALLGSLGVNTTTSHLTSGLFLSPQVAGSRSLLHMDLSTPVTFQYSAAVGSTELKRDLRRYATAPCFAARKLLILEMDAAVIASFGPPSSSWIY
jgi:hypothetical protein